MKQGRPLPEPEAPSPAGKRRRAGTLQFWCDSFYRSKQLLRVLQSWRQSEHRIRHARTALENGDAIPADLKHIVDMFERAMQPLPAGTELYFTTYDPKWKYNAQWWLPCSRTAVGAEMAKRHHQPPPSPNAKVFVHKLVTEDGVCGVWAGGLGAEHDDEEEIVLSADLTFSKPPGKTHYRVYLSDELHEPKHGRHLDESESELVKESNISADEAADEAVEDTEEKQEKPASLSWNCIVS